MKSLNYDEATIWLAGLLDGEGYFGISKPLKPSWRDRLLVVLEMTDRDVVERAALLHPPAKAFQRSFRTNKKASYQVKWTCGRADKLMCRVLPYMGERRKQKIQECLAHPNLSHNYTTSP